MSEWINVDYRLPAEPSGDVVFEQRDYLVSDGEMVGKCDFQRGNGAGKPWANWGAYGDIRPEFITHWMPLPEPPK